MSVYLQAATGVMKAKGDRVLVTNSTLRDVRLSLP